MALTKRRGHPRRVGLAVGQDLGSRRPEVIYRPMPGSGGELVQGTIWPRDVARERVRASGPFRYTYVRGHILRVPNPKRVFTGPYARQSAWRARQMDVERAKRGNKCEVCEAIEGDPTNPIEFAHIAETDVSGQGRGQATRATDIRRNPEKYAYLCKRCHKQFDYLLGPVPKAEQGGVMPTMN